MGWILKVVWDAINDLQRDLRNVEQDYVRKDDFRDAIGRIEAMLTRIFDKLDGKVDK